MLLSTLAILMIAIFSTLAIPLAAPDPHANFVAKAIALEEECMNQGHCVHAPCYKNSGLECRVDGMRFCEFDNPPRRSTLSTFFEIFQNFRARVFSDVNSFPIPPTHQLGDEVMGEDEDTTTQLKVKIDMKLESYLKLGDEIIAATNRCSKAGSSCDILEGEHCCPSLVCYKSRGSGAGECHSPVDERSEDEEILDVLRKPCLSLEKTINTMSDEQTEQKKDEKIKEANKWDLLQMVEVPPRLDDITELPKCKSINMKCNPINFECRKARRDELDEKKITSGTKYEDEKYGGKFQRLLGHWKGQTLRYLREAIGAENGESGKIDDDEALSP
ncbi:hypothetical protein EYC80_005620 [Monilinia laxa]|uniref:Dickkopf N-terminal cysteine-rich domain-containing protein n=1 Tax=Monilinia laxa TaxID=61186 RepID=A0A5N6KEJ7_MONLA|nr:hypothetical protein EYC80_005620 [Monilinia laxa]